uniref:Uncharacterized protein n=1 Tax=Arundo donax TaxID=35708 RepID=A0A0A9HST4_ARUDO
MHASADSIHRSHQPKNPTNLNCKLINQLINRAEAAAESN